jgi:hypothetical protein
MLTAGQMVKKFPALYHLPFNINYLSHNSTKSFLHVIPLQCRKQYSARISLCWEEHGTGNSMELFISLDFFCY